MTPLARVNVLRGPLSEYERDLIRAAYIHAWNATLCEALRRAVELRGIRTSPYDTVEDLVGALEEAAR